MVGLTILCSISIGYFPPVSSWKSLEETVRGTIYEYQLYFADEKCIEEIENNVHASSVLETNNLFTLANSLAQGFLQIRIPYVCLLGPLWYPGQIWQDNHGENPTGTGGIPP